MLKAQYECYQCVNHLEILLLEEYDSKYSLHTLYYQVVMCQGVAARQAARCQPSVSGKKERRSPEGPYLKVEDR
jgi:hypothetical protein